MSANSVEASVRQLLNRLEDATSSERLDALQELQTFAKTEPSIVGKHCLQKVFEHLRERGSPEEYEESLDLIYRLVKCKNREVATQNSTIIVADKKNVELLLDLLEHETMTVGVTASQILTEIHSSTPAQLESQIQDCPAGLNKLLARLPDKSREEVRNQAIVFIQQLTANNEEMKKTVIFNEGFEMIFGIIKSENDVDGASVVVQDCLSICRNILNDSVLCQRLFFGMGLEYSRSLAEYFTPYFLENPSDSQKSSEYDDEEIFWADKIDYAKCAYLAMDALVRALTPPANPSYQKTVALEVSALPSAVFWIARGGPSYLIHSSLCLISRCVENNSEVGGAIMNMSLQLSPSVVGKNIPDGISGSSGRAHDLLFGWKPLPNDERRCIAAVSLFAERYVYPGGAWCGKVTFSEVAGKSFQSSVAPSAYSTAIDDMDVSTAEGFSQACLYILDHVFSTNSAMTGMLVQYVLAPPPPSPDDDGEGHMVLESMKPLCSLLAALVVDVCFKLTDASNSHFASAPNFKAELDVAERSANVLTLLFLHGELISRELSTALNTQHIAASSGYNFRQQGNHQLLPFLLGCVNRATRIQGTHGFVAALLRMLAVAVCECERATLQVLEDPANLFVIDLCSSASEGAGVAPVVQTMACMFLGSCYLSLKVGNDAKTPKKPTSAAEDPSRLSQSKLLSMVDAKVGLSRFTEILRRPLASPRSGNLGSNAVNPRDIFLTKTFKAHYDRLIEAIRNGILEHYTSHDSGVEKDSPLQQVVQMLNAKVEQLESELQAEKSRAGHTNVAASAVIPTNTASSDAEINNLRQQLASKDKLLADYSARKGELENELEDITERLTSAEADKERYKQEVLDLHASFEEAQIKFDSREQELMSQFLSHQTDPSAPAFDALKEANSKLQSENRQHQERSNGLLDENSKLTALVGTLSERIAELERSHSLQPQVATVEGHGTDEQWEKVFSSTTRFNLAIGLESASQYLEEIGVTSSTRSPNTVVAFLEHALTSCSEKVQDIANQCSDIAQGLQVFNLAGSEGTLGRIEDCVAKIQRCLEEQNEKLQESADATEELKQAEQRIESLQFELDSIRSENEAILQTANTDNQQLNNALSQQHSEDRLKWEAETNRLMQKLGDLEMERAEHMVTVEGLQDELRRARDGNDEDDVVSSLRSRVKKLSDENAALKEKHEEYANKTKAKLKEAADALLQMDREKSKLMADCSNLDSVSKAMYSMNESLNAQLNEAQQRQAAVNAELDEKNRALEFAAQSYQSLQQELAHVKTTQGSSNADNNGMSTSLAEQEVLIDQLKRKLQEEISEKDNINAKLSEAQAALSELEGDLGRRLEQAHQESGSLRNEMLQLQSTPAELESLKLQLHQLQLELAASEALKSELDAKNVALISQLGALEQRINGYECEMQSLNTQLEEKTTESQNLRLQCNDLTSQLTQLKRENGDLQSLVNELKDVKGESESRIIEVQSAREQLASQLSAAEDEVENLTQSLSLKSFELSAATSTIESQSIELAQLQSRYAEAKATKDKAMDINEAMKAQSLEVDRLNDKIEALGKEMRAKDQELHSAHESIQRLKGEIAGIKASLESVMSDLEYERQEHAEAKKKLSAESRQVKDLQRENDRLRTDIQLLEVNATVQPTTVKISVGDVQNLVQDIVAWTRRFVGDGEVSQSTGPSQPLLSELSESAAFARHELSSVLGAHIDELKARLRSQQRDIEDLTAKYEANNAALASAHAAASATAAANASSAAPAAAASSTDVVLHTPVKGHHTENHHNGHSDAQSSAIVPSAPSTGAGSARKYASPSATNKELAKLHAEMNAERRRLRMLQEEHTDLLGLLAQQELELSVFRIELNSKAGAGFVSRAENKVQKLAVKKYGTYTSYRSENDDSEISVELAELSP